ncbi:MAG: exodeoxyribonuclease VII small subunit [Bacteroidaceae bacterium]|nr:exodeoxyribonuclease VII small subunit [Bacteroidaceae bacterium]
MTYTSALSRIEEIVGLLENERTDLDQVGALIAEAQRLLKFCNERLNTIQAETQKTLDDGQG